MTKLSQQLKTSATVALSHATCAGHGSAGNSCVSATNRAKVRAIYRKVERRDPKVDVYQGPTEYIPGKAELTNEKNCFCSSHDLRDA
jgi:hypothetical protein